MSIFTGKSLGTPSTSVEALAKDVVSGHPRLYMLADKLKFKHVDGVLLVEGTAPSFYLKQILQVALRDVQGIQRVENYVNVETSRKSRM